ncbi:MAG: peptidyl-prolyl cis-trans isomerase, partial [Pseudomonadota bacterium]
LYEQREAQYSLPERRALYQIVYDAEAEAQAAAERVASGAATFDDLLAERGETRDDAALGEPTAEEIPSAAGRAAFELEAEGLAGPVDTGFGFALVDVAAVTPAETTPFEDARGELAADLRREAALDRAPELAGEIEDLRAGGMTLEEIAEEVGLPLRTAASVSRRGDGAEGFAADPAFLAEIFAAEEGEERDMVETDLGEWFVLRLDGIEEPALRPLEDVRDLVAAGWRADALRDSLLEKAEALEAELAAGKDIAAVAEELGVEARSEGPKTRLAGWTHLNEDMVEAVFGGDLGDAASGASPGRMDAVVVARVAAVADGPDNEENRRLREQLAAQMNGLAGEDALTLFMLAKQEEAGVSVNQQLIESILVGGGGHGGM